MPRQVGPSFNMSLRLRQLSLLVNISTFSLIVVLLVSDPVSGSQVGAPAGVGRDSVPEAEQHQARDGRAATKESCHERRQMSSITAVAACFSPPKTIPRTTLIRRTWLGAVLEIVDEDSYEAFLPPQSLTRSSLLFVHGVVPGRHQKSRARDLHVRVVCTANKLPVFSSPDDRSAHECEDLAARRHHPPERPVSLPTERPTGCVASLGASLRQIRPQNCVPSPRR
jgi:hypothetical protein